MTGFFLELNDWQLTLRDVRGAIKYEDSAAAATEDQKLVFGGAAHALARRFPQQFNNRYLYSLAPDPLAVAIGPARNHADLLYQHLRAMPVDSTSPITFGVGGHVGNQQLGLVLGICQELGFAVRGFIDTALVYALGQPRSCQVLDIEQHRLVVSRLSVSGSGCTVDDSRTIDGLGVAAITQGWMNVIADEFVQQTRFDPMHTGESEQQVYDLVRSWLADGAVTDTRIRVHHGDSVRELDLPQQLLIDKLRQRVHGLDLATDQPLAITPRLARIPFLSQLLKELGHDLLTLSEHEMVANLHRLDAELDPDQVRRITAGHAGAPAVDGQTSTASTASQSGPDYATHLLHNHTAYAFDHPRVRDHAGDHLPLTPGASVSIDGLSYTAIRLE